MLLEVPVVSIIVAREDASADGSLDRCRRKKLQDCRSIDGMGAITPAECGNDVKLEEETRRGATEAGTAS